MQCIDAGMGSAPTRCEYASRVELAVGDPVVYGNHGVGRIAAREKQMSQGTTQDVVIVDFAGELTVTLPVSLAEMQLRPLVSGADLRRVRDALRDDRKLSANPWLSRRRETLAKLTGSDPVKLAEVVSEGAQRERLRLARGSRSQLSSGEREIFRKARALLSSEIALALDLQPAAADGWIDRHLMRPV